MEQKITSIVKHLSESQTYISDILNAGKDVTAHMSSVVQVIPDTNFTFSGFQELAEAATNVTANVIGYLNSVAGLESALANHLSAIMRELNGGSEEE